MELADELAQRSLRLGPCASDDLAPTLPGGHHREGGEADEKRQPCSVYELCEVRREEHQVDQHQESGPQQNQRQSGVPHRVRTT